MKKGKKRQDKPSQNEPFQAGDSGTGFAIGLSLGVLIGIIIDNIGLGMMLGVAVGLCAGLGGGAPRGNTIREEIIDEKQ